MFHAQLCTIWQSPLTPNYDLMAEINPDQEREATHWFFTRLRAEQHPKDLIQWL